MYLGLHIKEMRGLSRLITKKRETLVAAYSGLLYLVCHPNEWDVPESVRSIVVNLPVKRSRSISDYKNSFYWGKRKTSPTSLLEL